MRFNNLLTETGGEGVIEDSYSLGILTTCIIFVGLVVACCLALWGYYLVTCVPDETRPDLEEKGQDQVIETTTNPVRHDGVSLFLTKDPNSRTKRTFRCLKRRAAPHQATANLRRWR